MAACVNYAGLHHRPPYLTKKPNLLLRILSCFISKRRQPQLKMSHRLGKRFSKAMLLGYETLRETTMDSYGGPGSYQLLQDSENASTEDERNKCSCNFHPHFCFPLLVRNSRRNLGSQPLSNCPIPYCLASWQEQSLEKVMSLPLMVSHEQLYGRQHSQSSALALSGCADLTLKEMGRTRPRFGKTTEASE